MTDAVDEEGARRLARSIAWLEGHINYERTGPSGDAQARSFNSGPDRRLRHVGRLMEVMDNPHHAFGAIHITGTNGKTSATRMITELVLAQGLSVGTFTSPHLQRVNERISINGEPISDYELSEVLDALALYEPLVEKQHDDDTLSYFEILTAAAFRAFADAPVDVGVIEVGVGGTYDSTNVIDARVAVVTNIGEDHLGYLGPTRADIATNKAGIIKPNSIAVIGDTEFADIWTSRPCEAVLMNDRDFALEDSRVAVGGRVATLRTQTTTYEDVFIAVHGAYQADNAALSLAAAEAFFGGPLSDEVVRTAFANVKSPGRMEVVHRQPLVVLDGAHNAAGAEALADTVGESFGEDIGRVLVVGMLRPHEPEELLPALDAKRARLIFACTAPSPRAVPAERIALVAKQLGIPCVVVDDVGQAVTEAIAAAADDEVVLVTGSLYVAGAARTSLLGV